MSWFRGPSQVAAPLSVARSSLTLSGCAVSAACPALRLSVSPRSEALSPCGDVYPLGSAGGGLSWSRRWAPRMRGQVRLSSAGRARSRQLLQQAQPLLSTSRCLIARWCWHACSCFDNGMMGAAGWVDRHRVDYKIICRYLIHGFAVFVAPEVSEKLLIVCIIVTVRLRSQDVL